MSTGRLPSRSMTSNATTSPSRVPPPLGFRDDASSRSVSTA